MPPAGGSRSNETSAQQKPTPRGWQRGILFYLGMTGAAGVVIVLVCLAGTQLEAPEVATSAPPVSSASDTSESISNLSHLLVALAAIVLVARAMGFLFSYFRQPAVIGEIVGGLMLGPSLLGRIAPGVYAALLPQSVFPLLYVHAHLGIILYMFLVGLELDLGAIRRAGRVTVAISHASIVLPFLLGCVLALLVYPDLAGNNVRFTVFALFLGVSLSVTAFPVLARILSDHKLNKTRLGSIALACAAVDDATAWCLLSFVVGMAQARVGDALRTLGLTVAFVALVLGAGWPLMRRLIPYLERSAELRKAGLTIILLAMIASAVATEYIGIHAIFGAFLLGAIIPSGTRIASHLTTGLEDVVKILFLPAFFALTGIRTEIGLISGLENWLLCGLIILVACLGKFGGTLAAARWSGIAWRDSAALGVLMNARGLVELIVLNIGLEMKVISPTLFAMLVVMALVTTFMTTPILTLLVRGHAWNEPDN